MEDNAEQKTTGVGDWTNRLTTCVKYEWVIIRCSAPASNAFGYGFSLYLSYKNKKSKCTFWGVINNKLSLRICLK